MTIEVELEQLEEEKTLRLELDGVPIVVLKTERGVTAYEDVCPHAGWRLDEEVVDGHLECPGHGWQFKADSGECVDVPAYCLRSVLVSEVGGKLRLELREQPAKGEGRRKC